MEDSYGDLSSDHGLRNMELLEDDIYETMGKEEEGNEEHFRKDCKCQNNYLLKSGARLYIYFVENRIHVT